MNLNIHSSVYFMPLKIKKEKPLRSLIKYSFNAGSPGNERIIRDIYSLVPLIYRTTHSTVRLK